MGADECKMLIDAFQAKHPSIRVDMTRLGSEKLLQRILTESRAGSHLFDAVTNSGMEIYLLAKMGLLARYTTPEFSSFMADSKDPAGRWVDMYSNLRMIGYNTKLVPKEKIPRRYEDLLGAGMEGADGFSRRTVFLVRHHAENHGRRERAENSSRDWRGRILTSAVRKSWSRK